MRRLLNQTEERQLKTTEILFQQEDWITLSELSKLVGCSVRALKDDIVYFKNNIDNFVIETSNNGIRLNMKNNVSMRSSYQRVLSNSPAYNLLELIFYEGKISMTDLTKKMYVSSSTIYRLIDQINDVLVERNFKIETNPCRIDGAEDEIRYFFYTYFYEKYSTLDWPFEDIDEHSLDMFLNFFIEFTQIEADFAYYNIFKTISTINLIRYKQGYYLDTTDISINFDEIIPDLTAYQNMFHYFEETNHVKVDNTLIHQLFTPYISEDFSLNYERLLTKSETNPILLSEINYLSEMLDRLSQKFQLSLTNKEDMILNVHNAIHLDKNEPRSDYILYNHNQEFVSDIRAEFPNFHDSLYEAVRNYFELIGKTATEDGINFIIYTIFIFWDNLLPEFRKKQTKIHVLVVSDRHISHSKMLKEIIEYEFTEQIVVDVYDGITLDYGTFKKISSDIIVANFPLPNLENQRTVYVESLPSFFDIAKIREKVDEIMVERMP